jgi:lipopolysaccharide export system protein LptC
MQKSKNAKVQPLWTRKGALLLLVLAAGSALGCRPNQPRETGEVVPELKLEGVRFRVYREASLRASGEAATVTYRRDTQGLEAKSLAAVLDAEGDEVRIAAPEGGGDLARRTFNASGGLVATRGSETARTDRAWYVPTPGRGQGLVSGDRPVVVQGESYRLEGNAFTYDPAKGEIVVHDGARLDTGVVGATR